MFYLGIIVTVFLTDFILKKVIDKTRVLGEKKEYFNGKIILQKYYNKGFALDKLGQYPKLVAYGSGFVCSLLTAKLFFLLRSKGNGGRKTALAMMIGGAASNIYDRFVKHHVVDYLSLGVKWKPLRKIVFNISDFFILLGSVLLVIFRKKK